MAKEKNLKHRIETIAAGTPQLQTLNLDPFSLRRSPHYLVTFHYTR